MCVCTCVHVCMHVSACVCVRVCVSVCVHVCVYLEGSESGSLLQPPMMELVPPHQHNHYLQGEANNDCGLGKLQGQS